jgi:hydroxymethylglutaryl-CoA lyase
MSLPKQVKLVEVGPRDGLQNEHTFVPTETKIALINRLVDAGCQHIEATAFVSPKWVPQMADNQAVMAGVQRGRSRYSVLVPNLQGLLAAQQADVDEIVLFTAASESFAKKNINCSIAESIDRFSEVVKLAKQKHLTVRGSISCCFGCPFEGEVAIATVVDVVRRLAELGCDEIDIADTIGVATAEKVKHIFTAVIKHFPSEKISGHFHDTYGQALTNIYAALQTGISTFHASVAGLGGCPYAPGATGNVATEDVLYLLHGLGLDTGIDLLQVARAGAFISQALNRPYLARAGRALLAKIE